MESGNCRKTAFGTSSLPKRAPTFYDIFEANGMTAMFIVTDNEHGWSDNNADLIFTISMTHTYFTHIYLLTSRAR